MINKYRIRNFKCFEDQELELGHLNVLTGLNGMGKSSVIQSLLLLKQSFEMGGTRSMPRLILNGPLVSIGTRKDALFEGAEKETIGFELTQLLETSTYEFGGGANADVMEAIGHSAGDEFVIRRHLSNLFRNEFRYLSTERLGPRTSYPMSAHEVETKNQLGTRGEYACHYLMHYGKQDIASALLSHPLAVSDSLGDQVEAWLGYISPGIRPELQSYSGMDVMNLQYRFANDGAPTNSYRSTNVGYGITYVLPLLASLLSAKPDSLLLLENPEAHLHPRGQVRIGELIARSAASGCQIIVETHSDHILNGIRLAVHDDVTNSHDVKLFYFEKIANRLDAIVSPLYIDRDGRIDPSPDGFFDEFENSLSRLIMPKMD